MSEDSTSYSKPKDVDFGLPTIHLKPLSKKKENVIQGSSSVKAPPISTISPSKRNSYWLAITLVFLLIVIVAVLFYAYDNGYLFQPKREISQTSLPPAISEGDEVNTSDLIEDEGWGNEGFVQSDSTQDYNQADSSEILDITPDESVEDVPVKQSLVEMISPTNQYHIIIASVPSVETAREDGNKLLADDVSIAILYPRAGRNENYRISAASFATLDEATNQLNFYRQKYGESVWVLRY